MPKLKIIAKANYLKGKKLHLPKLPSKNENEQESQPRHLEIIKPIRTFTTNKKIKVMTIAQQINWDFKTNDELEIKDKNDKQIYCEYSDGYWAKWEYDSQGNVMYYEDSDGEIIDKRPKPCEGKIVEIEGVKYKLTKV